MQSRVDDFFYDVILNSSPFSHIVDREFVGIEAALEIMETIYTNDLQCFHVPNIRDHYRPHRLLTLISLKVGLKPAMLLRDYIICIGLDLAYFSGSS